MNNRPVDPASLVTAVVLTYNSGEVIEAALGQMTPLCPVIVVDNASTDDTVQRVETHFQQVELVCTGENLGYGQGNNAGLKRVRTPYALVLNPDAAVDHDALVALLKVAEARPNAATLGPVQLLDDGSLHPFFIDTFRGRTPISTPGGDAYATDFLPGWAMLIRLSVFEDRGAIFDPAIFLFHEELDLGKRVAAMGHEQLLVRDAVATHLMCVSSGKSDAISNIRESNFAWSELYLTRKHGGAIKAYHKLARRCLQELSRIVRFSLTRKHERRHRALAKLRGYLYFLKHPAQAPRTALR